MVGRNPTNRTTLELKRFKIYEFLKTKNYQSHHTGIETTTLTRYISQSVNYQSHHTGIETN